MHVFDYFTLREGIKKWPEKTTTSLLGCHLGIYKMLQKHVLPKPKNQETVMQAPITTDRIKQGCNIHDLIFDIMSMAMNICTHFSVVERFGQYLSKKR